MSFLSRSLIERIGWTTGAYGLIQVIRLVSNVVLARLLAPELFGIMLIVTTLRTGVELFSDIGIGQNIVSNKNGRDPDFYNTAWTLQLLRGVILALLCLLAAAPIAEFYGSDELRHILTVISVIFVIDGVQSVGRFLLQKDMNLKRLSVFELSTFILTTSVQISFALYSPTVWALVFGNIAAGCIVMVSTFLMCSGMTYRLRLAREYIGQIFTFGRWIFVSTVMFFLATNFDRLFLARAVTFEVLGVYGVARAMAEIVNQFANRMGAQIVFPMVAATAHSGDELRSRIASGRGRLLLAAAILMSVFVASSDLIIHVLYDDRYRAAARLLPLLGMGVWFSILCALGESLLLGTGRSSPGAIANAGKLIWIVIGFTMTVHQFGLAGAVCVVAAADLIRYLPLVRSQVAAGLSFVRQDIVATLVLFGLVVVWRTLVWLAGFTESPFSLFDLSGF
jgi:O-antigen/teichoic acid export membrane protein